MDFNIRTISLADGVNVDARKPVGDLLGEDIEFRSGISLAITLPDTPEKFRSLPEADRLLTALYDWTRVYSYDEGDQKSMHVLATADGCDADADSLFYRVDLRQPPRIKPGPRPAGDIVGGAVMSYEECGRWLVEFAHRLAVNADQSRSSVRLMRPRPLKQKLIRLGWVGPNRVSGLQMAPRLNAVGQVFGAEIVHVAPRSFAHVANRLASALPLDAVIICSGFASYISAESVPNAVRRDLIHVCDSMALPDLEQQIVTWLEVTGAEIEKDQQSVSADENGQLLRIMLKGMLSHSKIGQFNHCQKATVLTGVRARHLNVSTAERILDDNSEVHQDTKTSAALFLWKDHNDGRQYFLNPQLVEDVKLMVAARK